MSGWNDDSDVGSDFGFQCPHCRKNAVAHVAGSVATKSEWVKSGSEPWSGHNFDTERVQLIKCSECGKPTLMERHNQGGWGGWDSKGLLWPSPRRAISPVVPQAIRETCEEAQGCFQYRFYSASVVMVRRTLEGVCSDQGSDKKTLAASLADLERQGKLDKRLVEWAHELRALGNLGAHFTSERVTREDAYDALAFVETLLDYLYVLSRQFEAFKKRREKRSENTSADAATSAGPPPDPSDAAAGSGPATDEPPF